MNTSIANSTSNLFSGSCGALGSPCEITFGIESATSVTQQPESVLQINVYSQTNCSGFANSIRIYAGLSTDTIISAIQAQGGLCVQGQNSFAITFPSLGYTPNAALTNTSYSSSSTLYACSLQAATILPSSVAGVCYTC